MRCEDILHEASLEAIEALQAENAALRKELSNAVIPKYKAGQTVYVRVPDLEAMVPTYYIVKDKIRRVVPRKTKTRYYLRNNGWFGYNEDELFLDQESAEAWLEEQQQRGELTFNE